MRMSILHLLVEIYTAAHTMLGETHRRREANKSDSPLRIEYHG